MKSVCMGALALLLATGCNHRLVRVRMDVPAGSRVTFNAGAGTPEVITRTPFVGQFESGSLEAEQGWRMIFELDDASAQRLGGRGATRIFARMTVGKPTAFGATQTLRLAPSEDSLRALVSGGVSEISAYVSDPNELGNPHLTQIVMRMAPF